MAVYSDHLEGYAWGENVGWIHFRRTGPVQVGVSLLMHQTYLPLVLRSS